METDGAPEPKRFRVSRLSESPQRDTDDACEFVFNSDTYFGLVIGYLSLPQCYRSLAPLSKYHYSFFGNNNNKKLLSQLLESDLGIWFKSAQLREDYFDKDAKAQSIIRNLYTNIDHCLDRYFGGIIESIPIDWEAAHRQSMDEKEIYIDIKTTVLVTLRSPTAVRLYIDQICKKTGLPMHKIALIGSDDGWRWGSLMAADIDSNPERALICKIIDRYFRLGDDYCVYFEAFMRWFISQLSSSWLPLNKRLNETLFDTLFGMAIVYTTDGQSFQCFRIFLQNFGFQISNLILFFHLLREYVESSWNVCSDTQKRKAFIQKFKSHIDEWRSIFASDLIDASFFTDAVEPYDDDTHIEMRKVWNQIFTPF